ncbi:hypothetical protein BDY21DRAFT_338502 [Lineolata rhizophorae]|uniref:Uncharacterized protein n=1 Tax=Lineolata rhizophorae TaxID=578093 RepID=A0A6A6P6C5_9PEZI|nr:hypothetical protein BDY21DRAFT_338502 [Lineolata rhizophorae]
MYPRRAESCARARSLFSLPLPTPPIPGAHLPGPGLWQLIAAPPLSPPNQLRSQSRRPTGAHAACANARSARLLVGCSSARVESWPIDPPRSPRALLPVRCCPSHPQRSCPERQFCSPSLLVPYSCS